jgi:hypothetical protein
MRAIGPRMFGSSKLGSTNELTLRVRTEHVGFTRAVASAQSQSEIPIMSCPTCESSETWGATPKTSSTGLRVLPRSGIPVIVGGRGL